MQPAPAIPPFEPPPLPSADGRLGPPHPVDRRPVPRDLRAPRCSAPRCCSTRRTLNIANPNAFITGTGLYFVFGLSSFWWVQQDRLPMPLPTMLFSLLAGDVFFLSLVMFAGGTFGAPLPILLFPQLAAAGWILRTQTAFFHAAFAAICLLGLDALPRAAGHGRRPAGVPDRHHRLRLLRDRRHRGRARPLHQAVGGPGRAARHRRREPRAGQPPHHPGHAGRRARGRPERRRARPQRAGHAPARRLRAHARRHAARGVLDHAARLLAALAGGLHRGAAAVQGRGHAAAAARAPGAHRHRTERRHAHLPRGPRAARRPRRSR